mgnify:CR=1 FL=1
MQGLAHFEPESRGFLLQLVASHGEGFGSTICDGLRSIYADTTSLTVADQSKIKAFLETGFRGFSDSSFLRFCEAYERSPHEARELGQNWRAISDSILAGGEIAPDLRNDPMYIDLVYAAYIPIGMSLHQVQELLSNVSGLQHHCDRWQHPAEGYQIEVGLRGELHLHMGEQFDVPALQTVRDTTLYTADAAVDQAQLATSIAKALLRGSLTHQEKLQIFGFFKEHSSSSALRTACRFIESNALPRNPLPKTVDEIVPYFNKLLSLDLLDVSKEFPPRIITEVKLFGKLARRVRAMRGLKNDAKIKPTDLEQAILSMLFRSFEPERRILKRERQKIVTVGGAAPKQLRAFLTKAKHAYLGRAAAALCTATENRSWQSSDFLQIVFIDPEARRVAGNIQLHLFIDQQNRPAVLARLNPTLALSSQVDRKELAHAMLTTVAGFAADNRLVPFLPTQTSFHELCNDDDFASVLQHYYGQEQQCHVRLTVKQWVNKIFELDLAKLAN